MLKQFDGNDAITADLHHLKAVLTILSHTFGGDCPNDERAEELQLCLCIQWANKVAERTYRSACEDPSTSDGLNAELMEMSALLTLMDTTNLALDMKIAFNDELMSSYLDAMAKCAERALRMVDTANTAVSCIREPQPGQNREAENQAPHLSPKAAKAA
ncbi:hypothetical protein WAE61_19795 [Comamonadaceae bacterium PP-2]